MGAQKCGVFFGHSLLSKFESTNAHQNMKFQEIPRLAFTILPFIMPFQVFLFSKKNFKGITKGRFFYLQKKPAFYYAFSGILIFTNTNGRERT